MCFSFSLAVLNDSMFSINVQTTKSKALKWTTCKQCTGQKICLCGISLKDGVTKSTS